MIETEDGNCGFGVGSIADCLNPAIKLESKDLLANRPKRRNEFSTIVLPPTAFELCAIAILRSHAVSWKTRYQIRVVQVRSLRILAAATLWLDMLHVR